MPKRKFSRKKSFKKRSFKRRKTSFRKKRTSVPRNLIPTKLARRFKYCETVALDAGATTISTHVFSCNGMFDPNITGVGHQPMGFDQYVGVLYDHYTVIGAKITVTFMSTGSGANTGPARVGITVRDTFTPLLAGVDTLCEQGATKMRVISALTSNNKTTMSYTINPAKFLGNSKPLNNENLKGTSTANPSEQCYFQVFAANINDFSNPEPVQAICTIEYVAVLTERRWLAES